METPSQAPGLSSSTPKDTDELALEVTCGQNTALLYTSRLQLGSKGTCLLFENAWLTPNEFQYVSGRETAKDWKRSIKHYGKSLKVLISKGILTTSTPCCCSCEQCGQTSGGTASNNTGDATKPLPSAVILDSMHPITMCTPSTAVIEASQNPSNLPSDHQRNTMSVHQQNSNALAGQRSSSQLCHPASGTRDAVNSQEWKGKSMGEYGSNAGDQAAKAKAKTVEEPMRRQVSDGKFANLQGYELRENGQNSTTYHNNVTTTGLSSRDDTPARTKQSSTSHSSPDKKPAPKTCATKTDARSDDKFKSPPERPTEQNRVVTSAQSLADSCQYNPAAYAASPHYAALRNSSCCNVNGVGSLMDSPFVVNPYYPMLSAPQLHAGMYYNNPYMMWPSMSAASAFSSSAPSNPYAWTPSAMSDVESDLYPGSLFHHGSTMKPSETTNPACNSSMFSFPWMNRYSNSDASQFSNLMLDSNAQFKADSLCGKRKIEDDVRRAVKQPCLFDTDNQMPGSGLRESNFKPLLSGFYPPYMPSSADPRNVFANSFVNGVGNNYSDFRLYSNLVSSPFGGMPHR